MRKDLYPPYTIVLPRHPPFVRINQFCKSEIFVPRGRPRRGTHAHAAGAADSQPSIRHNLIARTHRQPGEGAASLAVQPELVGNGRGDRRRRVRAGCHGHGCRPPPRPCGWTPAAWRPNAIAAPIIAFQVHTSGGHTQRSRPTFPALRFLRRGGGAAERAALGPVHPTDVLGGDELHRSCAQLGSRGVRGSGHCRMCAARALCDCLNLVPLY